MANPPGIAALMTFLSAPTLMGDPTCELKGLNTELPVELSKDSRKPLWEGGLILVEVTDGFGWCLEGSGDCR